MKMDGLGFGFKHMEGMEDEGGIMNKLGAWKEVVQHIGDKLFNWKVMTISVGGRLTLLKLMLVSLPTYFMSI